MIRYPDWEARACINLASELHDIKNKNKTFVAFLVETLRTLDSKNRTETNEVVFRQQQGACQAVNDICRMLENSRGEFARYKEFAEKSVTGGS